MNFGYNPPGSIKNYQCLRSITLWAGMLGVVQSIAWIGLTITGIIAYNCLILVDEKLTFGSLIKTIYLKLYFEGDCGADENDYTILKSVSTVLNSADLLIWMCVYLAIAVVWLLASVLLLTHLKKDNVKASLGILYTWVFVTLSICLMDFALGVIFGIDYGKFIEEAYTYNLNSVNAGVINANASQLVAAMVTSVTLLVISFKGFILWIINFGLVVYLLKQAIHIGSDKDGNDTLFMPRKESDDILTTRPPINAYDDHKTSSAYNNDAFIVDNQSIEPIELNQEPIERAARMSTDAALTDRRFRNLDAFQQYPPPRYSNSPALAGAEASGKHEVTTVAAVAPFATPQPDYSPPMSRAQSQGQNGLLRNQRYS